MKKFLSMLVAVVMVAATLFGCSKPAPQAAAETQPAETQAPETKAPEKTGFNISVILKTTASEYWGYVKAGCESYMKEHPEVKVTVTGPAAESEVDQQRSMVETALGDNAIDGYAFAPSNSEMIATACAGSTKPIVAIDTNFDAKEKLSFIGTGNKAAAKQGGEKAVALAKEYGWTDIKCIEIAGAQGDQTTMDRMDGYREGVNGAGGQFLDDEVQYGLGVAENATSIMEAIMQKFPEGIAIICANNDDMAAAAARAAAGNKAYEKTVFLGFDGTMSACKSILAGEETMSVSQEPFQMGYKAVEAVVKALKGQSLDSFIDSGAGVVDPKNAEARYNQLADYLGQPKYSGVGAGSASSGKARNISVILKTTASEYWGYVKAGCESYMKDHPEVKVTVTGPAAESEVDQQRSMVETALGDNSIDGYAFAPSNSEMIATACAGSTKPIVAIDTNFDAKEKLSFIGTGNKAAAKQGGEKAVALAKKKGWTDIKCIEIAGAQGDQTTMDRMDGYREGVNGAGGQFLDDEVQYGLGVAENATSIMEAIMQKFPDGIAIICANNDDMAAAAARAAAGNEKYKNTIFLGFDGTMSACKSILAGEETMSVSQEPFQMGYKAVEAVVKALDGGKLDSFIDSGAGVVDPDNAEARYNQLAEYLGQPKYSK